MIVSNSISNRIKVFDIIKLFAIFLVVWGHVLLHLQNYKYNIWENPLYRCISSFHMPLFMMISGFFSAKVEIPFKKYFLKKFKQLIIPSLSFGVIFVISWHFVCGGGVLKPFVLCYWFLKSAFSCALLYYFAMRFKQKWIGLTITVIISQFIFFYQINWMYIPFITGTFLFQYKEKIKNYSLIIMFISGCIYWIMFAFWNVEMASIGWFKLFKFLSPSNIHNLPIPLFCFLYKMIMGICGSLFFISLFIECAKYLPENRLGNILAKWGTLTLGIYLWQAILLEHIMMKTINLESMEWNLFNFVVSPLISIAVLIFCVWLTEYMKRNLWLSYIFFGGKNPKSIR